jgi:NAD(P)-dependent dehydrogenase (short-subunit alcohol dehydrogenase family)
MPDTVLITGAGRGLGLSLARRLIDRGHRVIGTVRSAAKASELRECGAEIEELEVAEEKSISALGERLKARTIDVLVNNAGVGSAAKRLSELSLDELQRCFAINSAGPLLTTRALAPSLRAGRRRVVMNITSQLGSISLNSGGSSYAYRSSKAALNQLTRSLAAELGPEGFTCLVVHPGWVRTDMGGAGAPLSPEESATALVSLIDGAKPAWNGKFLNYDGKELPW